MIKWLIEFVGATPCAAYAPTEPGWYTMNPWNAKCFDTKEEAESWMANPYGNSDVPFRKPWAAVEHGFDLSNTDSGPDGFK